jgi:DegV family protein with EDD domain
MSVKIVTDSTCCLDAETQQRLGIAAIPLSVNFTDESCDETRVSYEYFFDKISRSGEIPTSSQPAHGDFYDIFEKIILQGDDILAIFISSGLSGTYETAVSTRQMVLNKYPQAKIEIIDSHTTTMAMGMVVMEAARWAHKGRPIEEIERQVRDHISRSRLYFVPATLEYLKKGGRIGGAAALLGSILHINPVLYLVDGKIDVLHRFRGLKAAHRHVLSLMKQDYEASGLAEAALNHVEALANSQKLAAVIKERFGLEASVTPLSPVLGLHVGPGTIVVVYTIK